jgi:DNA-binding transcriptional LysR family regulator
MDVRQLEIFLAVLDSPTMTRAADRVHLSTAAVSVQVRALADELKTDLFMRSGKKLVPTLAARRLEPQARQVVRGIQGIKEYFDNHDVFKDSRPFNFACGATTLIYSLAEPLRLLRAKFSNLDLRVSVLATEEMVAGVLDGQFDLALISLPVVHPQLRIVPVFEEELLVLSPHAKRMDGSNIGSVAAHQLDNAPMVLYPPHSNMRKMIDGFFHSLSIAPRVIMDAADTEVMKSMVEAGFGSSVLPAYALINSRGFFRTQRVQGHRLARKQALALSAGGHGRPLTAAVTEFLRLSLEATIDLRRWPENPRQRRASAR